MSGGPSEGAFLDLVYAAALEPSLWGTALEQLAHMVSADTSNLSRLNVETGAGSVLTALVDPSCLDSYFAHYAKLNALLIVPNASEYGRSWAPRILTDEDCIDREALVRTEYYNDFLKPLRAERSMMIRLAFGDDELAVISIARRESKGGFSSEELGLADRLQSHLIRAFALTQRLAATRRADGAVAEALDRSPHAMLLLDAEGRIRHANRAGERVLGSGDGLCAVAGRLSATSTTAARTLSVLIGRAASGDRDHRAGGSMSLRSPGRRLPLSITVAPVGAEAPALFVAGAPSVLVSVADPEADRSPSAEGVRSLYALTAAETRVALALCEGLSPREMAARFDVSPNTVRSQLDSIYAKTGTHRQAELVRLLMTGVEPRS